LFFDDVEWCGAETKRGFFSFLMQIATHSLNELVPGVIGCGAHRDYPPRKMDAKTTATAAGRKEERRNHVWNVKFMEI
jgi:hypothetical protein